MSRIAAPVRSGVSGSRLKIGTSLATLALAISLAPAAGAQTTPAPFGTMVGMQAGRVTLPNGQLSQWTGARTPVIGVDSDGRPLMTIEQTQAKALLDWEDFRLQTNEVLEFQQQSADWIAVNRVHGNQAAEVNGEIRAIGKVYIFNDNGVLIGKDAKINTRTLVTGKGFSDVLVDGATTTLVQSKERAILDWSNLSLQAGEVLKFKQEQSNWIALNRSYSADVTRLAGDVQADGNIYLVAPAGLSVAGKITAQQVVLSSLYMRDDQFDYSYGGLMSYARDYNNRMDPTFSNTWIYNRTYGPDAYLNLVAPPPEAEDASDPLKYNVTIGKTGSVTTGEFGKVMLFGPDVTNKGLITVRDEGQVILAAGENIYLTAGQKGGMLTAYTGAYNPLDFMRVNIPYSRPPQVVSSQAWQDFYQAVLGEHFEIGDTLPYDIWLAAPGKIEAYLDNLQSERARALDYTARNEGIITLKRGGNVEFRGLSLEQMGAIDMTSTALFRGDINFRAVVYDYREYANGDSDGPAVPGHGSVTFGRGSLTQITPDLESSDKIPLSSGDQNVGSLKINASSVHMEQDSLIYMPSGKMNVLLDAGGHIFDNNRGQGANQDNEDGTRFLMDAGATIDLSGWETTLEMGYHQVTGKLFAAQLADSPVQQDGPLYRKEITVDRRFGTNLANWQSFDNLSEGTLAQFLVNGGSLTMDIGDDLILKPGSVIDVSGGVTTYKDGYVYTTLLRRLDGSVIDIREADPDELYMGLANEWVVYDTKWGKQESYYIPLMSSAQGRYETSYQHGGKGGSIEILAPDAVLQGTLKGETVAGRYQRNNLPAGGSFALNNAGESEGEYVSNNILITAVENALDAEFGLRDRLSDIYGDLFGDEFEHGVDGWASKGRTSDNTTLASADFFNRSTMGSYELYQGGRVGDDIVNNTFVPRDGTAVLVEDGVNLNLKNGADFTLGADQRLAFLGSIRTEGGDVTLGGMSLTLGDTTRIDTRGSWYSDYEIDEPIALASVPRIHGGNIGLSATASYAQPDDSGLFLPDTAVLDSSGGAWVDRDGKLTAGRGGNLTISAVLNTQDGLDLGALAHARAYGLGGNGKFSLVFGDAVVIGDTLPDPEDGATGRQPLLFTPDFFKDSGFSAITLQGRSVTVQAGTQIEARSATLQLREQTLNNGLPPAYWTPSGTDIYDVADIVYQAPHQRPTSLRRGMDLSLAAVDSLVIGEGSLLSTEVGGKLFLGGRNMTVAGTLLAPAGAINLTAGSSITGTEFRLHVTPTGRLLAPGVSLITWRGLNSEGRELVDGEIYDGGSITLGGDQVILDEGAVLDVSGTHATFDLQTANEVDGVSRNPVTLASDGGSITIGGQVLSLNDATYRAQAGGASARGGSFSVVWDANYGTPGGGGTTTPTEIVDYLEMYAGWGYIVDENYNPYSTIYGIDLSQVNWEYAFGPLDFPPGFTVNSRAELIDLFDAYGAAGMGVPPMFVIGDPIDTGTIPTAPDIEPALMSLFQMFGYSAPTPPSGPPVVTNLSPLKIGEGGFSALNVTSSFGIIFSGDVSLGGKKADGSYIFDTINLNAGRIMGTEGSDVRLEAGVVQLDGGGGTDVGNGYYDALKTYGVQRVGEDTTIEIKGGTLLQVVNAAFSGFEDTRLTSGGDIRFVGYSPAFGQAPTGSLYTPGKLTLKADQVYAATGRVISVLSDTAIEIQAQDDGGPINESPYEAAAKLTFKAPRIVQGGTVRSPLGSLTLEAYDNGTAGSGEVIFTGGSLTSVSGDGKIIPYGYTSNGDTWIDPFTGLELTTLPAKTINLTADKVDLQDGAVMDVSGGGDLFAREFVPGVNGTLDWLTGYRDENYDWVSAPGQIYAVVPDFEGNVAPVGFGGSQIGIGDKVYLSGGSGLPAGYYTLLPAEYALLPGAYRVTASHRYGDAFNDARLGEIQNLTDGSSIQSGYRVDGASGARDQRTVGYHVMSGETLRTRSYYRETQANTFFTSDAFLKKALRVNRPIGDVPRIPLDGGSVVFRVADSLNLDGRLESGAGEGGRGGFADIASTQVVVAGADTDLSQYDGYLVLDTEQLNGFGAESLLIGGVRQQGQANLELSVTGTNVVVDNAGSVLFGPELLFASNGNIDVAGGSKIETRGEVSGSSGDLRVLSSTQAFKTDPGTPWDPSDDILVHGVLDQGTVLRLSSGDQVDILRNADAVKAMAALRDDPQALAAVNAARTANGLAPLDPTLGILTIHQGASLKSSRSVALDATNDTVLETDATLETRQLSASASRISIGDVPAGTSGLVFAGGSLGTLTSAQDLTLKSYSTIDLHGGATLAASGGLRLDTAELRVLGGEGVTATLRADNLTLTNSNGGFATAEAGGATLVLEGDNIHLEGEDKWLSGIARLDIKAAERLIGRDDSTLYVPGDVTISAGGMTTDSGARLFVDATGAINATYNGNAQLPVFQSFGGTLGLTGASVTYAGQTRMTGGTINLQARSGDVTLAQGSILDVTSNVSQFFDKTVGVGAGSVTLVADLGDVVLGQGSLIDVSGSAAGGDAGTLTIRTGVGKAQLNGTLKGSAQDGFRSGSFNLLTQSLSGFAAFNTILDAGGFRQSRRFEINSGDVTVDGTIQVQDFAVIANDGSVRVTGTVKTTGDSGGRIQVSAAQDVVLTSTGRLLAQATTGDGAGGTVLLETSGAGGGAIATQSGSVIDVSGTGEGGRLVRFRAPQIGGDIAIEQLAGTITGARSVIAEGYRVYDDVAVIDQGVIDTVSNDATAFMSANADAIRARLGSGVTLTAGIELRSDNDMELTQDWDMSDLRFDGAAGVLTLRAKGDLLINANLSDGFSNGRLMDGDSWTFNLTAGANTLSPDSMAVLTEGQLAAGKGSVVIGGVADTLEYFFDPAYGNENRLYQTDLAGNFIREDLPDDRGNYHVGFVELERDPVTGKYIDPRTGNPIEKDPVTGDYADTAYYARRPLPWFWYSEGGGYQQQSQDGTISYAYDWTPGFDRRDYQQWDNSSGYAVRTGVGSITLASARDLILEQRASVIYTAGHTAAALDGFYAPSNADYADNGGDISLRITGDIVAGTKSAQLPNGFMSYRSSQNTITGLFAQTADRPFDQTTWWVNYADFEGGIGALGGGNIDIEAGGDIYNLGVAIPVSGRVTGNTVPNETTALTLTGGGDLTLKAGGNIAGGVFYVAEGEGDITAGGAITAGGRVLAADDRCNWQSCYVHTDPRGKEMSWDLHPMFFTSSGRFTIKSGGALDIDGVMDPMLLAAGNYNDFRNVTYTDDASVSLFSAGGTITVWNNGLNTSLAHTYSAADQLHYVGSNERGFTGSDSIGWDLRPATFSAVAAAGDVRILGGMTMMPSATGNLELLAGGNVYIGYGTQAVDPFLPNTTLGAESQNYRGTYQGIYMSQADMTLIRTPTNTLVTGVNSVSRQAFRTAGDGVNFSLNNLPDLHVGDSTPVRIYAAGGDIVTSTTAAIVMPKLTWLQAEGNIYFPTYDIQHNSATDFSLVRAGEGIYFAGSFGIYNPDTQASDSYGFINVRGPGRLEIEAGTDIWLPSNAIGITSSRIKLYPSTLVNGQAITTFDWKEDEAAADIAISTGFNQSPAYDAFEDAYINPETAGEMADYLKDEDTGKSLYLFDREYKRADGATGEFATPEPREGLVNYVRRLQGLQPLKTRAEQVAYLDTAWSYWQTLSTDFKTPFYRSVLFLELRTTGREANDPENDRYSTTFRGYDAIATLFPGAQKTNDEALDDGESRWAGDFETYASRVMSFGGGKVEFVIPGGGMTLANVAALPSETGQPANIYDRGNALRAGVVTTDGGEINIVSHDSVVLNESRILTTKGGNVMIWSSWGDIAAGKGAKTAISPQFYNYKLDNWGRMMREPAGLPTGAGIGTLATQEGVPPADVDLIAPAGVVDAGDAGIRVSGNFNVFAIQILGTDNIDVAGVSTGLPVPPAAPPTSLDVDVSSRSNLVDKALQDAVSQVQKNKGIVSPSLIEVKAADPDEGPVCGDDGTGVDPCAQPQSLVPSAPLAMAEPQATVTRVAQPLPPVAKVEFDIPPQPIDETVRDIGKSSDMTILYDSKVLQKRMAGAVSGHMTPEEALMRLLGQDGIDVVRVGPNSIMLKKNAMPRKNHS